MSFEVLISIILGFSLAAAAGFRVFVPLLILSFSANLGWFEVAESWQWVGSTTALLLLGVATIIEVGAYLIPWVDNILDSVAVPLAGVAGTLLMVATMGDLDPVITWSLAIIAGGGAAAAISGSTSATRLGSTVTTGGIANPVLATTETLAATTISALSIVSPFIALFLVVILFWLVRKMLLRFRRK